MLFLGEKYIAFLVMLQCNYIYIVYILDCLHWNIFSTKYQETLGENFKKRRRVFSTIRIYFLKPCDVENKITKIFEWVHIVKCMYQEHM